MRQSSKVQGTKIAQAAKDLNVTSVTIRRYLSEFDIQTTTDSNGIKVLPDSALEELKEVRRLKEDGMTNPKVMEALEEMRAKSGSGSDSSDKADKKKTVSRAKRVDSKSSRSKSDDEDENEESESESEEEEPKAKPSYAARRIESKKHQSNEAAESTDSSESSELSENSTQDSEEGESIDSSDAMGDKEGRVKHSLTCQTCSKVFEHMNPKLRDCLDCYRTKRKERRRGGSDRHKTVIQHPIAQQVTSKMASQQQQNQESNERERQAPNQERERPQRNNRNDRNDRNDRGDRSDRGDRGDRNNERNYDRDSEQTNFNAPAAVSTHQGPSNQPMVGGLMRKVRSYRKAIEDTRQITGSLKRRLERPDLPEGERRWLEQIYAYQLILHQGWRHLSEYRMATQQQGKED